MVCTSNNWERRKKKRIIWGKVCYQNEDWFPSGMFRVVHVWKLCVCFVQTFQFNHRQTKMTAAKEEDFLDQRSYSCLKCQSVPPPKYILSKISIFLLISSQYSIFTIPPSTPNAIWPVLALWNRKIINCNSAQTVDIVSFAAAWAGRSHVMLPVPTRLLQTDIHSFLGNKLINVWRSFSCECSRLWLVQQIQWQLNERLIGPSKQKRKTARKECMSVWSSRVGTGSVTWLRPERLRS